MSSTTAQKEGLPPQAVIIQMAFGFILSQALSVAAKLRIADILADGPKTADEIAQATNAHGPSVFRLLRALAKAGVFKRDDKNRFSNTELSEFLRSDHPESMRGIAHMICDKEHWMAQGSLEHSVRTGDVGFEHTFGKPIFEYYNEHPEEAAIFFGAMTSLSMSVGRAVAVTYDFSGVETVADIGGGHGILLKSVLKENPELRGILYDQPEVIAGADDIKNGEFGDRVELETGDFFKECGVDADVYMLKHIVHDWNDDESVHILSNIAKGASEGAKVLLIESVVEETDVPSLSGIMDLNMLAMTNGRERTAAEYAEILERSGWHFNRVIPTPSPMQIIEAVKE